MRLDLFSQVVRKVHPKGKLLKAWPLTGGVSSWVVALATEEETIVFRLHSQAERDLNPRIARDEHRLLQTLRSNGLPVPEPLLLDESGEVFPEPYLVTTFIDGETGCGFENLEEMASTLAQIHDTAGDFSFLPRQDQSYRQLLDRLEPSVWKRFGFSEGLFERFRNSWPPPAANPPVLLHGDFWPGNILWKNGAVTGVIDWEDAATGDPLSDLATTRLELLWAVGREAAEEFTRHYLSKRRIDAANLPWWDVVMVLRAAKHLPSWGFDAQKEADMMGKAIAAGRAAAQQLSPVFNASF